MRINITGKQLIWLSFLLAVGIIGLSVGVFALGLKTGVEQLLQSTSETHPTNIENANPTEMLTPTLPVAMTATSRGGQVQEITFSNSEATQLAQEQSNKSTTSPVQVHSVSFRPNEAQMSGVINYLGLNGPFEIVGVPYVEQNRLRLRITSFKLAGQTLPTSLYGELQGEVDRLLDDLFLGYDIQSVDTQEGILRLSVIAW